jgi:hypothetical protein
MGGRRPPGAHRLRCLPVDEQQHRNREEAVAVPLQSYESAVRALLGTQAQQLSTSVGWGAPLSGLRGVGRRDLIGEVPAARGRLLRAGGVALSARARTIRDWSMVCLRDSARPVLPTQHPCCERSRSVRPRWPHRECLELDELRHARAAQPGADSLRAPSRTSSATPTVPRISRQYGRPFERRMRDQIGLATGSWGAEEEQARRDMPANSRVS